MVELIRIFHGARKVQNIPFTKWLNFVEKFRMNCRSSVIFLLIFGFFSMTDAQKKPKKKPKIDYKKKIHCLVCLSDYATKKINFRDTCINPAVNVTEAENRWLTVCPSDTNFCAFELHTINDVFTAIERRCATSCVPNCYTERYGTEKTVCTYCCKKSIKPEDFNDDTVYEYICADLLGGTTSVICRGLVGNLVSLLLVHFYRSIQPIIL